MKLLQDLYERANAMYTPADVLSKVTAAGKVVADNTSDSVGFALEDSEGKVVKVYVAVDQSAEFEDELSNRLSDLGDMDAPEIAELLYDLQKQYNIINVTWPAVVEDEEEMSTVQPDPVGDTESMEAPDGDAGGELSTQPAPGGDVDADTRTAFAAIVQAMTADSEARRQEALAKAAEARAREAEAAAEIANGKLKAEEEVADMEAYYDSQQDEKKEAKKLSKLAKYRHTLKQRDDNSGPFNDYKSALSTQTGDSEQRMDAPSGEPLDGVGAEDRSGGKSDPIDVELDDFPEENEEVIDVESILSDLEGKIR